MQKKIKIRDIVTEMEAQFEESTTYMNRKTGEFVMVADEYLSALESDDPGDQPSWFHDMLPKFREATESKDYVALPSSHEIHEWSIMRDFGESVSDGAASSQLLDAIHGKGAFRYLRDRLEELGLTEQWDQFRYQALAKKAADWLQENGILYEVDS